MRDGTPQEQPHHWARRGSRRECAVLVRPLYTGKWTPTIPWHTLMINVSGSLVLGAFMALALAKGWGTGWRLLIAVGFAGGFTTFSAFAAEGGHAA
ncbi:MAG: FluC/FEX family fluoride channel [Fimbriimonadales bacterium]